MNNKIYEFEAKIDDVLSIPDIKPVEIKIIGNLQKAIKTGNFIAFLIGEEIGGE